jgi:hypothetical protein
MRDDVDVRRARCAQDRIDLVGDQLRGRGIRLGVGRYVQMVGRKRGQNVVAK